VSDSVVIEEAGTGYRFSWGLALAGGLVAIAVSFMLLTIGSGVGLLLVHRHMPGIVADPRFLTGGAIYFLVAEAFGLAAGGHVAGRLLGPMIETTLQEEIRAALHGLVSWAVAVVGTLILVAIAGPTIAALYGVAEPQPQASLAEAAGRTASYASLWIGLTLLFGGIAAMVAAAMARIEDDRESPWGLFAFHRGWR